MAGEPGTTEVKPGTEKVEPRYLTLADKIKLGPIKKPSEATIRSMLGQYERYNMILAGKIPSQDNTPGEPEIKRAELVASKDQLQQVLSELGFWEQVRAIRLAHHGFSKD